MAYKMGRGVIEFLLRDDHLRKGIARAQVALKSMQASMQVASRWARNLLMAMGAGFVYLVKTASSAQETTSKFKAVFKEQAKAAGAFARDLASSVNRAEIDIKSWLSTLQDTFVPMGFARSKARLFSQQLVKLAIDLASFNDTADATVIRDLQSAIVGNHETMRKYGVIIMQLTLDQELLRMGYKGGAKAASEQAKAQARLNIIMAGTADAQGDAARTAREFANTWKGMLSSITMTATKLGSLLLPGLGKLVTTVRDAVDVVGGFSKNEMMALLDAAKTVGKWLILIWATPMLLGAINNAITLIGRFHAALLRIKSVSAMAATGIIVGVVMALGLLASAYAKAAMQAARLHALMFKIAVASRREGRLIHELGRVERRLGQEQTSARRLADLRKQVSIRERLFELAEQTEVEATKKKEEIPETGIGRWMKAYKDAAGSFGTPTEYLQKYQEDLKRFTAEIETAQRGQREWSKKIGESRLEIEKLEDAELHRAKVVGAKPGGQPGALDISVTPPEGARAEAQRPQFVGLQEMYRRFATADGVRSRDLAQRQLNVTERMAKDTERTREAVEKMAETVPTVRL